MWSYSVSALALSLKTSTFLSPLSSPTPPRLLLTQQKGFGGVLSRSASRLTQKALVCCEDEVGGVETCQNELEKEKRDEDIVEICSFESVQQ